MKVESRIILKLFLNFSDFEPEYSNKLCSYKTSDINETACVRVRRSAGATVKAEGRSSKKGTCIDYDSIMTSELKLEGYFSQICSQLLLHFVASHEPLRIEGYRA